jgi:hypothetical protein
MKYPKLWQLHNAYKKHNPKLICMFKDSGMDMSLLYCPCGRFWISRPTNPAWQSAEPGSSRGAAMLKQLEQLPRLDVWSHWQAYKAIVAAMIKAVKPFARLETDGY